MRWILFTFSMSICQLFCASAENIVKLTHSCGTVSHVCLERFQVIRIEKPKRFKEILSFDDTSISATDVRGHQWFMDANNTLMFCCNDYCYCYRGGEFSKLTPVTYDLSFQKTSTSHQWVVCDRNREWEPQKIYDCYNQEVRAILTKIKSKLEKKINFYN